MKYRQVDLVGTVEYGAIVLESADDAKNWLMLAGRNEYDPEQGRLQTYNLVPVLEEKLVPLANILKLVEDRLKALCVQAPSIEARKRLKRGDDTLAAEKLMTYEIICLLREAFEDE